MTAPADPFGAQRLWHADGPLAAFNEAGVLSAADVQVARRLAALAGIGDTAIMLAAAFAVRALRMGHVFADLRTLSQVIVVDADPPIDAAALPWPDLEDWLRLLADSRLVAVGENDADDRPLRLVNTALYLDRYWRQERELADDLISLREHPAANVDEELLADGLRRLFDGAHAGAQARAARASVTHNLAVVAGGPGTGKTTTVARIASLLAEQTAPRLPLIALAAPTARAADRMQEAVRDEAAGLAVPSAVADWLGQIEASTLHRLLGRRPDHHGRFRHHRGRRLPHDVVIVDEASMVSLTLMGRLTEALRPGARLILVGDPDQLTSVEAGAVLGDIVAAGASADDGVVVLHEVPLRIGHRRGRDGDPSR